MLELPDSFIRLWPLSDCWEDPTPRASVPASEAPPALSASMARVLDEGPLPSGRFEEGENEPLFLAPSSR